MKLRVNSIATSIVLLNKFIYIRVVYFYYTICWSRKAVLKISTLFYITVRDYFKTAHEKIRRRMFLLYQWLFLSFEIETYLMIKHIPYSFLIYQRATSTVQAYSHTLRPNPRIWCGKGTVPGEPAWHSRIYCGSNRVHLFLLKHPPDPLFRTLWEGDGSRELVRLKYAQTPKSSRV
jgi:hypothetical protein